MRLAEANIGGVKMTAAELKYLIATDELYNGSVGVRLTELAAKMGITKVSVYKAAIRLENSGCIERDENNKLIITEYGYKLLGQYRTLIDWFSERLRTGYSVSAENAQKDAIGAACALSDESRAALANFIERTIKGGNFVFEESESERYLRRNE